MKCAGDSRCELLSRAVGALGFRDRVAWLLWSAAAWRQGVFPVCSVSRGLREECAHESLA